MPTTHGKGNGLSAHSAADALKPEDWFQGTNKSNPLDLRLASELSSLVYDPFLIKIPLSPPVAVEPTEEGALEGNPAEPAGSLPKEEAPLLPYEQIQLTGISYQANKPMAILSTPEGSLFLQKGDTVTVDGERLTVTHISPQLIQLEWKTAPTPALRSHQLSVADIIGFRPASANGEASATRESSGSQSRTPNAPGGQPADQEPSLSKQLQQLVNQLEATND